MILSLGLDAVMCEKCMLQELLGVWQGLKTILLPLRLPHLSPWFTEVQAQRASL